MMIIHYLHGLNKLIFRWKVIGSSFKLFEIYKIETQNDTNLNESYSYNYF